MRAAVGRTSGTRRGNDEKMTEGAEEDGENGSCGERITRVEHVAHGELVTALQTAKTAREKIR